MCVGAVPQGLLAENDARIRSRRPAAPACERLRSTSRYFWTMAFIPECEELVLNWHLTGVPGNKNLMGSVLLNGKRAGVQSNYDQQFNKPMAWHYVRCDRRDQCVA